MEQAPFCFNRASFAVDTSFPGGTLDNTIVHIHRAATRMHGVGIGCNDNYGKVGSTSSEGHQTDFRIGFLSKRSAAESTLQVESHLPCFGVVAKRSLHRETQKHLVFCVQHSWIAADCLCFGFQLQAIRKCSNFSPFSISGLSILRPCRCFIDCGSQSLHNH